MQALWRSCAHRFLSTPSARRATEGGEYSRAGEWISIHALREEGDTGKRYYWIKLKEFLSTPSARRATKKESTFPLYAEFLSTPSARRAT